MSKYYQDTLPKVVKNRSKFLLDHNIKTSTSVGRLTPFLVQEVLPGDTFKMDTNLLSRLSSAFIKAPMDNLTIHVHYFFVPNRLVVDQWAEIMGENKKTKWAQKELLKVPHATVTKVETGSLADYFGIPVGEYTNGLTINEIPFRAYALIYNEWFRDQNNQDPVVINTGATGGTINNDAFSPTNIYGKPAQINKFMDYFTSALLEPQKGDPVKLPIGDTAPIIKTDDLIFDSVQLNNTNVSSTVTPTEYSNGGVLQASNTKNFVHNLKVSNDTINLAADLTQATATTVNDLRMAFQLQKLLEKDARGGTRYTEIINYQFGVQSDDARLQRPEFLSGTSTPLQIGQVLQTSGTAEATTPQANISAYSLSGAHNYTGKSFTEHGTVIGLVSIRQKHTYQQSLNKYWNRKVRTDFYNPVFANIGEQPIYSTEIFSKAPTTDIFGFNEAFADYRYKPDIVTGQMRSDSKNGFDLWHFADNYENAPVLGDEFIEETPVYVDRTIAVPSTTADQFILDINVQNEAIRVMPTYSVPGMIDHN